MDVRTNVPVAIDRATIAEGGSETVPDPWAPGGVMDDERFVAEPVVRPDPRPAASRRRRPLLVVAAVTAGVLAVAATLIAIDGGERRADDPPRTSGAPREPEPFGARAWSEASDRVKIVESVVAQPFPPWDSERAVGIELVALGASGELFEVDLEWGTVVRTNDPTMAATQTVGLFAAEDVVVGIHRSPTSENVGAAGFRLEEDRLTLLTEPPSTSSSLYRGPDGIHAWRISRIDTDTRVAELVDLASGSIEHSVDLGTGRVWGEDGRGGLVLDLGGRLVAVDTVGRHVLPAGSPLAIGSGVVYTRRCAESGSAADCVVVRHERETGDSREIDLAVLDAASNEFGAMRPGSTAVSPDGDVLFVRRSESELGWAMVDTATGRVVDAPGPAVRDPIIWSADSRFAVYLSGRRLRLYDRDAATISVIAGIDDVVAIASPTVSP